MHLLPYFGCTKMVGKAEIERKLTPIKYLCIITLIDIELLAVAALHQVVLSPPSIHYNHGQFNLLGITAFINVTILKKPAL